MYLHRKSQVDTTYGLLEVIQKLYFHIPVFDITEPFIIFAKVSQLYVVCNIFTIAYLTESISP